MDGGDDLLLFDDDPGTQDGHGGADSQAQPREARHRMAQGGGRPGGDHAPWRLLIVDDDSATHATTKLVLHDLRFSGRPLVFLSADSAAEARRILRADSDIAVILLDVVMESDDAGLRLARWIREELGNARVRIILRTGQPGQAPERQVVLDYDINDYKTKTELTAQKLFTSVVAALRGFQHIVALEAQRLGVERLVQAAAALMDKRTVRNSLTTAVGEIERLVPGLDEVLICGGQTTAIGSAVVRVGTSSRRHRGSDFASVERAIAFAGGGRFTTAAGRAVAVLLSRAGCQAVDAVLASGMSQITDAECYLALTPTDHPPLVVYLSRVRPLSTDERRLVEVFVARLATSLGNGLLYEELSDLNRTLEQQVADRTQALEQAIGVAETARHEAEAANRAKSLFLATMSHEIRNPMNGVQGMLEALEYTPLSADQRELLGVVRESATSLLTIINDILDFSKIEAGRLDVERVPVTPAAVVEGVAETLAPQARAKGLAIDCFIDPALPQEIVGDPVRLRQVLFNMTGNAVKFTEKGAVTVRADRDRLADGRPAICLSVIDSGIGISPADQQRLFQPFTQADLSTTRRFGGTGLGLSICRRLAELMGGLIGVESEPGHGSRFWFRFPCQASEPSGEAGTKPRSGALLAGLTVAVMGSDQPRHEFLTAYLRAAGAAVRDAPFGSTVVVLADPDPTDEAIARIRLSAGDPALPVVTVARRSSGGADRVFGLLLPVRRTMLARMVARAAGRMLEEEERAGDTGTLPAASAVRVPDILEAEEGGELILVVDDHPTNRSVALRQLGLLGRAALTAGNGLEALAIWRQRRIALVLTDCHMPDLDGYGLAQAIRTEEHSVGRARVPIVAVTGGAFADERQRCLAAGMDEALSKPIRLAELARVLGRFLAVSPAPGTPGTGEKSGAVPGLGAGLGVGGGLAGPLGGGDHRDDNGPVGSPWGRGSPSPIDREQLEELFGDDEQMLAEVLSEFLAASRTVGADLRIALGEGRMDEARRAAHKLAGAAKSVGAVALAEVADAIEIAVLRGHELGDLETRVQGEMGRVTAFVQSVTTGAGYEQNQ